MLLGHVDLSKCWNLNIYQRMKDNGWKFAENFQAYKILSPQSRTTFLESLDEYMTGEIIEVPCGSCISCRLDYSKDWANRCHLEASQYLFNWFVTLTYNDDELFPGKFGNPTLMQEQLTDFIHKVRDKLRYKGHVGVRYFGCGEYGEKTMRPHYHLILFNCPLDDVTPDIPTDDGCIIHKKNALGDQYYYSKTIADCWNKGMCIIADCNWNTSAYVSRYVMKKQKGQNANIYDEVLGIDPPFLTMSRMPGIGEKFFQDHVKDLLESPYLHVPKRDGVLTSKIPRYYMKLLKKFYPDDYKKMLEQAQIDTVKHRRLLLGQKTINHNRKDQEENLAARMQAFSRENIS